MGLGHSVFRGCMMIILLAAALLLLLLGGGTVYVAANLFSEAPLPPGIITASPQDQNAVRQKIQPLIMQIIQSAPGQTAEMTLTDGEFNAAVEQAIILQQTAAMFGAEPVAWPEGFDIRLANGMITCNYSYRVRFRTPFGSYLNSHLVWQPEIRNGQIDFTIHAGRIGDFELSPSWTKTRCRKELARHPEIATALHKIVADLYITGDKTLFIRYYPYEIKLLLQEKMAERNRAATGSTR
ncbi:MAG: hypothetical protein PHQ27_02055 [Victivallales bacterium]|nr:hypothetical protein [Victivallales bacterium]